MREIDYTHRFKRDYRREQSGMLGKRLQDLMRPVLALLVENKTLPPRYRNHALSGVWLDHRDCHIRPDLVLIYRFAGKDRIELVRLGSHSELGL